MRGVNALPWQKLRLGSRAPDRQYLNWHAGPVETFLQIQDHLAALHSEQMVPRAGHTAFQDVNGKDVDVPRRDLQSVSTVVEKFWAAPVEHDTAMRTVVCLLPGHRLSLLKQRFRHS
jgi:hypothetical protein